MKLEDLKKLCDEEKARRQSAQPHYEFYLAARTYMPRLIAVAEAAKDLRGQVVIEHPYQHMAEECANLDGALKALESE
jgi:hypothetical protein